MINKKFPDLVVYDYTFVYLHLMACRMLDGDNKSQAATDAIIEEQTKNQEDPSVFRETWLYLDDSDLAKLKYQTFEELVRDFEKLLMEQHFFESIPELNIYYNKRVQNSEGTPAPFSERVKYIVEHPVFSRLMYVPQLSLAQYVYPTATHTRLEHSIGTFRNCCLYIQSLFVDPYNPLFKQLTDEKDMKCVLLASLLHDLGQYPLAHEMGEVAKEFKHESLNLRFLDNQTIDKFNHTLRDIIENEDWGWGVKLDNVKEILKIEEESLIDKKSLKTRILSSIISGPIDVDKLDYLLRDSHNCYLRYGESIDFDRLIRNLTLIIFKDDHGQHIVIGTYEKGQSAAESLAFARYLLYQSVYWHHTVRAIRAMLREAIGPALTKKDGKKNFYNQFDRLLGVTGKAKNVAIVDILDLISDWTDNEGKKIIEMIKSRKYYKRILTIHSEPAEKGRITLLGKFGNIYEKTDFQNRLQTKIKERFEEYLKNAYPIRTSLLAPNRTDNTLEILSTPKKIICDCPKPAYGTNDDLRFIPEPQRLQKNYSTRTTIGQRISEVWNEVYFNLMNIVSKGRIFCHPDIRDTLMAALGPESIRECLEKVIKED